MIIKWEYKWESVRFSFFVLWKMISRICWIKKGTIEGEIWHEKGHNNVVVHFIFC